MTKAHGAAGLPAGTIRFTLRGSAGQSFGAWLAPGIELTLVGDAQRLRRQGPLRRRARRAAAGRRRLRRRGERDHRQHRPLRRHRRQARSSAASPASASPSATPARSAVVEGVGDHGCEYMTGGRVVVLGPTGRNFAAGMSGGIAYVLDEDGGFRGRCNLELVGFEPLERDDADELRALVEEHLERTGSPVAARAARQDWASAVPQFVKVMPHDYKRALADLEVEPKRRSTRLDRRRRLPDDRVGGGGADGQARRLPQVSSASSSPSATRASGSATTASSWARCRLAGAAASRARAAWSAASRSATTAARSAT